MKDFIIMTITNFSHAQNYQIWKDMKSLSFLFFLFFPPHMYNSNTNSLIIEGAHLANKNEGY